MRPRQSSLGICSTSVRLTTRLKASMRPRQSSLGIFTNALYMCVVVGFNEAEAIKPRNPVPIESLNINQVASMRPRQSSLGILARRHRIGGEMMTASMRPRQSSLGILKFPSVSLPSATLQ